MRVVKVYENSLFEELTGGTIRPGGFKTTRKAMDFCAFSAGARLLDIGCGRGATVGYLKSEYAVDCVGIDSSSVQISRGLEQNPRLDLKKANAGDIPYPRQYFDGVLAECSLSIMGSRNIVLGEVNRVMKDSGKLIISDLYIREGGTLSSSSAIESCALSAFSSGELEKLLHDCGFEIIFTDDHTKELKELMADIILEHGSLELFFQRITGNPYECRRISGELKGIKLGYFLAVACKSSVIRKSRLEDR